MLVRILLSFLGTDKIVLICICIKYVRNYYLLFISTFQGSKKIDKKRNTRSIEL